ncbi:MAG: hypothetical protein AAGD07_09875 [Planctomycetota bacterium]
MTRSILAIVVVSTSLVLVGCSNSGPSNTVEDAEQSAIDAYLANEAADQEAMDSSLGDE